MSSAAIAPREKLVQPWVTVDNIAAEEDGGHSFVSEEPYSETTDKAFKASVMLGANTHDQSRDYWPYAKDQGEYGQKLNTVTKFVASSKLDEAASATLIIFSAGSAPRLVRKAANRSPIIRYQSSVLGDRPRA